MCSCFLFLVPPTRSLIFSPIFVCSCNCVIYFFFYSYRWNDNVHIRVIFQNFEWEHLHGHREDNVQTPSVSLELMRLLSESVLIPTVFYAVNPLELHLTIIFIIHQCASYFPVNCCFVGSVIMKHGDHSFPRIQVSCVFLTFFHIFVWKCTQIINLCSKLLLIPFSFNQLLNESTYSHSSDVTLHLCTVVVTHV